MITEIVTFALPQGMTREQVIEAYRQSAVRWRQNPELIRKNHLFDEAGRIGGGVYLWKTLAAAKRGHDEAWRRKVLETYGAEPQIRYFATPVVVDNAAEKIVEDSIAA